MTVSNPTPKGQVLQDVVAGITGCQQSLQRQGQKLGSVSKQGNAFWGVLKLLHEHGSMTVPKIAELRKVSRQRIQVMVDDYAAQGYLSFKVNPSHKRSQLVELTNLGKAEFSTLSVSIYALVELAAEQFSQDELATTVSVLKKLQGLLDDDRVN